MSQDNRVVLGQIGVGRWGVNLTRTFSQNNNSSLTHICDPNMDTAVAAALKINATPTSDMGDILGNEKIDAVIISTPSSMHFDHVIAALNAGKHVFVEKPMANSVKEAKEMIKLAQSKSLRLMVGHTFLYNTAVRDIKLRIDEGELGEIYYIYSRRLNLGQFRRDSDVLWTLAPHDISIINYWLSERPKTVSARGLAYIYPQLDLPEVCFSQLDFPSKKAAHLHLSWIDPQKCREMVVIGSKKMIVYDDTQSDRIIQIFDKRVETEYNDAAKDLTDFRSRLRAGDVTLPNIKMTEPLVTEAEEFIDAILGSRPALTDGFHGLESVAVMTAMSESVTLDGKVVPINYD